MTDQKLLTALLAERSSKKGHFILASGRESQFYIDARLTTMSPEGLSIIGRLGLEVLRESGWQVDAVGGLTLGADPISYAISRESAETDRPVRAFTVRKEAKTHGTGKVIEGPFRASDHVAVIEDVITTGSSALRAIEAVRAAGGTVSGVLAVVDRQEGGRESLESAGIPVIALATAAEIMAVLETRAGQQESISASSQGKRPMA
jgi:orotate phosphoribosyltransferase